MQAYVISRTCIFVFLVINASVPRTFSLDGRLDFFLKF